MSAQSEYNDEAESKYGGHSRVIVNLVDSKYGIDGIYQSDPTWDNVIGEDSYVYSLMTFGEAHLAKRYLYNDSSEYALLSSNTLDDFYKNINNYMDNLIYNKIDALKLTEEKAKNRVVTDLLYVLKKLDINYYRELLTKYSDIDKYDITLINKYFVDFLYDVGKYIVSKINNPIKLEQIKPCITALYNKFYGLTDEEIKKEVDRTIKFNNERMSKCFPTTHKINPDGTKEVYSYMDNKFEESNEISIK